LNLLKQMDEDLKIRMKSRFKELNHDKRSE